MIYQDKTNKQGVLDLMRSLVKADENTLPEIIARPYLNMAIDDYYSIVQEVRPDWQFDDGKWDDLPITNLDITIGQQEYKLNPSFLSIKDVILNDTTKTKLKRVKDLPLNPANGKPTEYILRGEYIVFNTIPDFNLISGLEVNYERSIRYYDGRDEQVLGIPSIHYKYIAMYGAYIYAIKERLKSSGDIYNLAQLEIPKIQMFHSRNRLQKSSRFISLNESTR